MTSESPPALTFARVAYQLRHDTKNVSAETISSSKPPPYRRARCLKCAATASVDRYRLSSSASTELTPRESPSLARSRSARESAIICNAGSVVGEALREGRSDTDHDSSVSGSDPWLAARLPFAFRGAYQNAYDRHYSNKRRWRRGCVTADQPDNYR